MADSNSQAILWHYTDAPGLLGMLETRHFMASSATYLNDDQELIYGENRLSEALSSVARDLDGGDFTGEGMSLRVASEKLTGRLNPQYGQIPPATPDSYIVSFCEEGDLLSQWRGYSQGSGFALGFDREKLEKSIKNEHPEARLEKVRYGDAAGKEMFEKLIRKEIIENQSSGNSRGWNPSFAPFGDANTEKLLQEVGWCKHDAFREEQEWRLKVNDPKDVKVRIRRGNLLPYAPFPFDIKSLKSVYLGPGGFETLRKNAVKHALQEQGLKVFEFTPHYKENYFSLAGRGHITEEEAREMNQQQDEDEAKDRAAAEAAADVKIFGSSAPYRP